MPAMSAARRPFPRLLLTLLLLLSALPFTLSPLPVAADSCVVTNTNDSGNGSLRAALGNTDGFSNCTTIVIAQPGTITLASNLPAVTGRTVTVTSFDASYPIIDRNARLTPGAAAFSVGAGGSLTLSFLIVTGAADGVALTGGSATVQSSVLRNNAFALHFNQDGTAFVTNSTLSGNQYGLYFNQGGAAFVTNSTLSGNQLGLSFNQGGGARLTNSTLSNNDNGFAFFNQLGSVALANTLLAKGASANCSFNGGATFANVTNTTSNLADDNTCFATGVNGSQVITGGTNPLGLDPAGPKDNGGLTTTIALLATSPAIDAGDAQTCAGTSSLAPVNGLDQRGAVRPALGCDIGAVERSDAPPAGHCVVTSITDSGAGTLRQLLNDANCGAISFDPPVQGPWTITLSSNLPDLGRLVVVTGPGAAMLTIDHQNASVVGNDIFPVTAGGDLTVSGMTLFRGYNGVLLHAGATATVRDTVFDHNDSGITLLNGGTATVVGSTFSASSYAGLYFNHAGGVATVTNSTFAANGIGLSFVQGGSAMVTNTTLSGNTFANLSFDTSGGATLANTLLAKGQQNCEVMNNAVLATALTNNGHNLADDATCALGSANGNKDNTTAGLDSSGLQDNGGPTKTVALLAGSAAIDAGNDATCQANWAGQANGVDQRGTSRTSQSAGLHCDIGAYEYVAAPSPSPSPSPSPGTPITLTVSKAGNGSGTATPLGTTTHPQNGVLTLTATPDTGSAFTGWSLDGTLLSWKLSVDLTMDRSHVVVATFQLSPTFRDVQPGQPFSDAIQQLAARGVINGCFTDPATQAKDFCPGENTLRHQMAALIARAMPGWVDETGLPTFGDNTDDTELMTRVATLQRHNVVRGYQADVCAERNIATPPGCYGPLDTVKYGQVMLFIARAMVEKGYWTLQADDRTIFPDQNGAAGAPADDQQTKDHHMVVTYVHYVPSVPDVADIHANFVLANGQGWGDAAPRAWFTRAFWPALQSYFDQDNLP